MASIIPPTGSSMPIGLLLLITVTILLPLPLIASDFKCPQGDVVVVSLGEGVIMRTCMWEKAPGMVIRTGAFELFKNDILILQSQTNIDGKLHGGFTSWDDSGAVITHGNYVDGLKHGEWLETNPEGVSSSVFYEEGKSLQPQPIGTDSQE